MAELQQQDDQPQEPVAEFWSFPTDPAEFDNDERISFSRLENKYIAVQEDGAEYEWDGGLRRWIPIVDDALIESHQAAYGGGAAAAEEDEATTAADRRKKKRKAAGGDDDGSGKAKRPRQNTAVYVTGLPLDVTVEEIAELFSRKCGVIAENIDDSSPRIKLYTDGGGNFKGDALVVFFKPQSVDMAIMLLDDTDFRITPSGLSSGRIRVQAADTSYKRNNYDQEGGGGESGADGGGGGGGNGNNGRGSAAPAAENSNGGHGRNTADKAKVIKKAQKMSAKLADWDDDDPYPHLAAAVGAGAGANGPTNKKAERTVILRHMFTLKELDEDPAALLEIKEDIRDECEKLGEVTNVVLFDLEEDGIVSVRFRSADAAQACIKLMHGRSFDGRTVQASLATGKEKYRRSKDKDDGLDEEDA
ncbi:hypothetical protein MCOR25_003761 [Pyricularia grisea]|nr:hypothetical protein MCOR25_003761 [Pyricularia grisea]